MVHNKIKNLELINTSSNLSICFSKHRVSSIYINNVNVATFINVNEGVVTPMDFMLGVFTTASLDNTDVQIKSSLPKTSLHGTAAKSTTA